MQDNQKFLNTEIQELRRIVTQINSRLDALENKPVISPASVQKPQPETVTQPIKPAVEPESIKSSGEQAPSIIPPEKLVPFLKQEDQKQVTATVEKKPRKETEWEQILGGNWLARIGILALIIGIGFFLKYAFDNNWIGPTMRVILGSAAGFIMLWLGFYWRKRYAVLTQVLSGGGIAVFYLSIFASSATYHLISIYVATILLLAVSVLATILALRYNSIALSIIGIFGAYFAPFILGAFSQGARGNGTTSQATFLIIYIIIIGLGALVLSTLRNWRWFSLFGLVCSLITYGFWYEEFHRTVSVGSAEISITIIFLIFAGATSLFHIIQRKIPEVFDYILMILTAASYTGISMAIMWEEYRGWMGGFTLLLALLYGLFAYFMNKRSRENDRLSTFALSIGLVLLTIAIPIQFRDHATATIAFAAEGLALMWLAFREKLTLLSRFSYVSFCAMAVRLFAFDTRLGSGFFTPVFNERFLAFIFAIVFTWLAAYILWRNREKSDIASYPIFLFGANFFTLWVTAVEILDYTRHIATLSGGTLSLLILLALAAVTIMNQVIWRHKPETIDLAVTAINHAGYAIISIFLWHDFRGWMGMVYLLFAVFYSILAYQSIKKTEKGKTLGKLALAIAMIYLTVAIPVQFRDGITTPVLWAAEMTALVWLSFRLKLWYMRPFSYLVFMAMFWDLLVVKTVNTNNFTPFINQRFLAFIIAIGATYLTFFLLRKRKQELDEWSFAAPYLLVAANLLTLWVISFEVWDGFGRAVASSSGQHVDSLMDARNLSLTGVWAVYAVIGLIVGIWKHWRWVRIGSLCLLAITIVKVFAYDVFQLEINYRIIAFVGLGLLLLASAYLYQRYRKIIKGVFVK
jgi:hypothetical protein